MLKALFYKFVKTYTVDEERSEDTINQFIWDACISKSQAINPIARNGILMFRLKDDPWYV
jgi:hypothetical protein